MSQNTSSAVMQQRAEPHDSLDDFPTMPWATRALIEYVLIPRCAFLHTHKVWEPACNRGFMVRPLDEYFSSVYATDIHDYGWSGQDAVVDFLFHGSEVDAGDVDWVISNPPFRLAEQFIEKAFSVARVGCAFIVRSAFLESVGRYESIFKETPPRVIAQFSERVPMLRGRIDPKGTTATSYCWLAWLKNGGEISKPTEFVWIPPCRKSLERIGDYQ